MVTRPQLILIGGEAWSGKTTCARLLLESLDNAAWLDGDDVWRVNPWSVEDLRLRTSDVNMAFVVANYLRSAFDHVILSSIVLSDQAITDRILDLLTQVQPVSGGEQPGTDGPIPGTIGELPDYDLVRFTLDADEPTLAARARERDGEEQPVFRLLGRAASLQGTVHLDTTGRTPEAVVDAKLAVLRA